MSHSGERTDHSGEWTAHSEEWTAHSREWMSHSQEWTAHSEERMSYSGDWMTHSCPCKARSAVVLIQFRARMTHPWAVVIHFRARKRRHSQYYRGFDSFAQNRGSAIRLENPTKQVVSAGHRSLAILRRARRPQTVGDGNRRLGAVRRVEKAQNEKQTKGSEALDPENMKRRWRPSRTAWLARTCEISDWGAFERLVKLLRWRFGSVDG